MMQKDALKLNLDNDVEESSLLYYIFYIFSKSLIIASCLQSDKETKRTCATQENNHDENHTF